MAFEPKVTLNEFPDAPAGLIYFNDSSIVLYHSSSDGAVYRSQDDGASWKDLKLGEKDMIKTVIQHPYDNDRAYALTITGKSNYVTVDKGENWKQFEIPHITGLHIEPFGFHAEKPDYILLSTLVCPDDDPTSPECAPEYFYTKDSFKNTEKLITAHQCKFARSTKAFTEGDSDTVICSVIPGGDSDNTLGSPILGRQLAISDNFFKDRHYATFGKGDDDEKKKQDPVSGVVGFGVTSKFFIGAVAASDANHNKGDEVRLVVSKDLKTWTQAKFSDESLIKENSFTVLESSDTSLHIDVLTSPETETGTFYTSNSDGTYFTKSLEHTERNFQGLVDIEKIEGIDGIIIANVVDEWNQRKLKQVRSKISYNDGRTWHYLSPESCQDGDEENCGLNLHSVMDHRNLGRIFSSPAPGIIAGIGNTGKKLTDYEDGDFYISQDSGLTWHRAQAHAQLYEFGDQGNVIVSAFDEGATDKISYSLDRGKNWKEVSIGDKKLRPKFLFTTPDATSLKFILMGKSQADRSTFLSAAIDFTDVYDKKCKFNEGKDDDFEKWYARYNASGSPNCLMGHKQYFWRKKESSQCYVGDLYHEQHASKEDCTCQPEDYECDDRFVREGEKCVPTPEYAKELTNCKEGTKYKRPSGLRLVPGNTCKKDGGVELDKEVEAECGKDELVNGSGEISHTTFEVDGIIRDYFYLKAEDSGSDETIVLRTNRNKVYVTHDQGGKWEPVMEGEEEFIGMYPHPYFSNYVYLITLSGSIHYSDDRAHTFKSFEQPIKPNSVSEPLLGFHPKHPEWLLYNGEEGCENLLSPKCQLVTYYTQNNGEIWQKLIENSKQCRFVGGLKESTDENLIFCNKGYLEGDATKLKLVSSSNFFTEETTHFSDVIGYAHEREFLVAAMVGLMEDKKFDR